ncbi:hypothetical protein [Clostridium butyricum]|uniref:hypothetical protein n=1 Tax=Clostridium butyricum TaxID=1492 RepID=UPI0022E391B6|nr:hypothetical protein [Clostridium butyricum]
MDEKKKNDDDIKDRMCLYAQTNLLHKLEKLGKKRGLSKQKMALLIIGDNIQNYTTI